MNKLAGVLLIILLLQACNSKETFNKYKSIKNQQWFFNDTLKFSYKNTDTISKNNVFINIRNTKNYPFNAIFLITKIHFPNGYRVVDTLQYEMTDAEGNFLGNGFTDIKENKLLLRENVVFKEKGIYNFFIQQATRSSKDIEGKNPLSGIADVGLSIEKNN